MAREPQYGVTVNGWERLLFALAANIKELPHLEAHRALLVAMLAQVQEISAQQAAMAASKQEATKRLRELFGEGRKLATFLRAGIRQHYGNRSEKLVEFDLQPFRARVRPAEGPTKPPTVPPATPDTKP